MQVRPNSTSVSLGFQVGKFQRLQSFLVPRRNRSCLRFLFFLAYAALEQGILVQVRQEKILCLPQSFWTGLSCSGCLLCFSRNLKILLCCFENFSFRSVYFYKVCEGRCFSFNASLVFSFSCFYLLFYFLLEPFLNSQENLFSSFDYFLLQFKLFFCIELFSKVRISFWFIFISHKINYHSPVF